MAAFDTSTTTSLPSWFTNAQQNAAQGVTSALSNITQPGQTVAQPLVQSLSSATNPFTQGTATLQDIASGAANPWLPSGQPNTNTALGGLFAAQNAKLDQILPSIAAKEGAAGIGSGNYGGLRGQTAVDTARAGALTTLGEQQNQAALNALTQGIQAETAVGNLGAQYGTTALNTANFQQLGALPSYVQASNALGNIGAKTDSTIAKNAGLAGNYQSALSLAKSLGTGASSMGFAPAWLQSLLKGMPTGGLPSDSYTGSPNGLDISNIDYNNLYGAGGTQADYTNPDGSIIGTGTAIGEGE